MESRERRHPHLREHEMGPEKSARRAWTMKRLSKKTQKKYEAALVKKTPQGRGQAVGLARSTLTAEEELFQACVHIVSDTLRRGAAWPKHRAGSWTDQRWVWEALSVEKDERINCSADEKKGKRYIYKRQRRSQ